MIRADVELSLVLPGSSVELHNMQTDMNHHGNDNCCLCKHKSDSLIQNTSASSTLMADSKETRQMDE